MGGDTMIGRMVCSRLPCVLAAYTLVLIAGAEPSEKDKQCHACQAVVKEVLKKLQPKVDAGARYPVSETVGEPCSSKNFYVYNYPPPQMATACEQWLGELEDEDVIEETFSKAV